MKSQSLQFKKLVEFFRNQGYTVETNFETPYFNKRLSGYWFARIAGKSIRGGFCEPSGGECYWYIDGRIAFDNKECFDKWSKCPYSLELPQTQQELDYILESMKYLRTREGFEKSDTFNLFVRDYPFSTHLLCPVCGGAKKVNGKRKLKMRPKDIVDDILCKKASGISSDEIKPAMYRIEKIRCPKCRGKGKVRRS